MQTKQLFLAIALTACTSAPKDKQLPSATFTPHMESQASSVACGQDVAYYGNPSPDLAYGFTYDSQGRITNADGVWLADNETETTTYAWDGWNLTNMLSTSSWDGAQSEITASYHPTNGLSTYTWSYTSTDYTDAATYTFSNFLAPDQPAREDIAWGGETFGYDLVYDATDRLVAAVPDSGDSTTWTYDDAAGTITIDTGNGAFTGVMTYDTNDYRELSAVWGGSDPSVIDADETYAWTGDQLNTITYRSGSEEAPHQLEVWQTDTLRYNCAAARQLGSSRQYPYGLKKKSSVSYRLHR